MRLARRELGVGVDHGRAAFRLRQQDRVRSRRHDGVEVGVGEAGRERVDAHEQARPRCLRDLPACRNAAALARAASLRSGAIESSRSTITASAPLANALSSLLPPSAGTKRRERMLTVS